MLTAIQDIIHFECMRLLVVSEVNNNNNKSAMNKAKKSQNVQITETKCFNY